MNIARLALSVLLAGILVLIFAANSLARDEAAPSYIVIHDFGAKPSTGTILNGNTMLDLADGQRIRLFGSNGKILDVVGPHRGTLPTLNSTNSSNDPGLAERLFNSLQQLLQFTVARSGDQSTVPDPSTLDLSNGGRHCVAEGQELIIWKPAWPKLSSVRIERITDGRWERTWWDKDSTTNVWPFDVPADGEYAFLIRSDRPKIVSKVTLLVIDPLPTDPLAASSIYAKYGCFAQAHRQLLNIEADHVVVPVAQ